MAMPEDYEPDEMMSIVSNKDFLEFEDEKQIVKLEVSRLSPFRLKELRFFSKLVRGSHNTDWREIL